LQKANLITWYNVETGTDPADKIYEPVSSILLRATFMVVAGSFPVRLTKTGEI
tara:strand:+ start:2312 stop:2470 length:159 start_codon:yes stop_codon:yes gene_type:complete